MSRTAGRLAKFLGLTLAIVSAAMAIGYMPTLRLGGPAAIPAMLLGGAIALVGSWVGAVPVFVSVDKTGRGSVNVMLGSTALRLAVVVLVAVAAALSGFLHRPALLIWVGICYLLLLVPDSFLAAAVLKQPHKTSDR